MEYIGTVWKAYNRRKCKTYGIYMERRGTFHGGGRTYGAGNSVDIRVSFPQMFVWDKLA